MGGVKSGRKYLSRLKAALLKDATERGVDVSTVNICVVFGEEEEHSDLRTVVNNYDLAKKYFTAKYLYVLNIM